MKTEYLKGLWLLRFEKLKRTEDEAAWAYQAILDRCLVAFGESDEISEILRTLVREERMHSTLADELIAICRRNHAECGIL